MTDDETKFRKASEDALRAWLRSPASVDTRGTLRRIAATDGWNAGVEWLLKMVTGSEDPWAYVRIGTESKTVQAGPQPYCHGAKDGECSWEGCPQERNGEPTKSGRHCPLDLSSCPSCDGHMKIGDDDLWHCTECEETHEPTEATKAAVAAERARFKNVRVVEEFEPTSADVTPEGIKLRGVVQKFGKPNTNQRVYRPGCENCRNPSMPYGICHRCGRKWGICAEANRTQDPPAPAAMRMSRLLDDLQKRVAVLESVHKCPCGCGKKAKK